jgi:hypothetical protein
VTEVVKTDQLHQVIRKIETIEQQCLESSGLLKDAFNKPYSFSNIAIWRLSNEKDGLSNNLKKRGGSSLAIRKEISPLDMYCYLKARFGNPNGPFSNLFRDKNTADNLIHWDFVIKSNSEDIMILGFSQEIEIILSRPISDEDWCHLILNIKEDFSKIQKKKSAVLKSLKKHSVFLNKYLALARVCDELHSNIKDYINVENNITNYKIGCHNSTERKVKGSIKQANLHFSNCLQLSILTPILAEAYVNTLILILVKQEILLNKNQFDRFMKSTFDKKQSELSNVCTGFSKDFNYRGFDKIRAKRNDIIHCNINPKEEMLEEVYYDEETVPLYKIHESNIGAQFRNLEKHYNAKEIIEDYEGAHMFILEIMECLDPTAKSEVSEKIGSQYLACDNRSKKIRSLQKRVSDIVIEKKIYDDQLDCRVDT